MNRLLFSLLLLLPISGSGHGIEIDSSALRPLASITVTFAPIESTVRPVPAPKPPVTTSAGNPKHAPLDRRQHRSREGWERIIPTHVKVQYAGGMGFLSFGAGWDYGRKCQWETDLYLGFLPRSKAGKFYLTATLKQNHIPWDIACGKRFSFTPFYYGLYINTIFGEKFWVREPERYPRKYYTFSTKVHSFLFIGQRFSLHTNRNRTSRLKGITFYYELSTCDLYLISAATNRSLGGRDIVGLSAGVKLQLF